MRAARIVLVEDETLIAMDLEDDLVDRGYEVAGWASTVAEARRLIDGHRPDLVILDMHLRDETTFELAGELALRGVPHLFVSGNDRTTLPPPLRDRRLLAKPVQIAALVRAIDATIAHPA